MWTREPLPSQQPTKGTNPTPLSKNTDKTGRSDVLTQGFTQLPDHPTELICPFQPLGILQVGALLSLAVEQAKLKLQRRTFFFQWTAFIDLQFSSPTLVLPMLVVMPRSPAAMAPTWETLLVSAQALSSLGGRLCSSAEHCCSHRSSWPPTNLFRRNCANCKRVLTEHCVASLMTQFEFGSIWCTNLALTDQSQGNRGSQSRLLKVQVRTVSLIGLVDAQWRFYFCFLDGVASLWIKYADAVTWLRPSYSASLRRWEQGL